MIVVLFVVSTVGAGLYLSARPSGPTCSNGGVNYPSCNSCGSSETYSSSTNTCYCTDYAVNPPSCNRFCANNAINPPNCDRCPDNHTDVVCPPGSPLRPTRPRTVIASHIHSRKARTVLFQKGRCRYRRSGDIISDGYVVILRVRMPQTRSTV